LGNDLDTLIRGAWLTAKTILPWLTGGLAGAILTYMLNQRSARRSQAGLVVRSRRVDYSFTGTHENLKELRVSYGGEAFDDLALYQIDVVNESSKTVADSPILVKMSEKSTVVEIATLTRPLNRESKWEAQPGNPGAYIWNPGQLQVGDSGQLRVLVAAGGDISWVFRGSDSVVVLSSDRESPASFEADVRAIVVWVALYVLAGSIPLLGGSVKAALLLVSLPSIVRYAAKWRVLLGRFHQGPPRVVFNVSEGGSMRVDGGIHQGG
jgi:hypothetical protein